MRDLAAIQRDFYDTVTGGTGAVVYAEMYLARLHDVLAGDHPKLREVVGDDGFATLVADYLRACPPRTCTVRDVGDRMATYLAARTDVPHWLAELAALERGRVEVFDAADGLPLARDDLAAVAADELAERRLVLVPASVLVELSSTVDEVWSAIEDGRAPELPVPARRVVLVWRRELRVLHRTLDADEAELVARLVEGASIADLSVQLADAERLAALLGRWLDEGVIA